MTPVDAPLICMEAGRRWTTDLRDGVPWVERCRFEAGWERARDGSVTRFTGPVRGRRLDVEPPPSTCNFVSPSALLQAIGATRGKRVALRYVHVASTRVTVDAEGEERRRAILTWALLGAVTTPRGRRVPVGWSGSGDGVERLADRALRERLAWIVERVDRADATEDEDGGAVLSPQAAALLLHESVGHFAEGAPDEQTDLRHRLGVRIASEGFSVFDDPGAEGGATRYPHDDEAIETLGATQLVRDGVLVNQLHSCGSAARAGTLSTANGRAAPWSPPLPRMSNLVCSSGDSSDDELVDQLGEGIFVHQLSDGFAGFGLAVEARIVLAERISRGKRTGRFVSGGHVAERVGVFCGLEALGKRRVLNPNGLCGKANQLLFDVGSIAPAMRLARLTVRS